MTTAAQPLTPQEQNKHLVLRWFEEVWNQGRRETIFELFPEGAVLHDGASQLTGPEEFCRFHDALRAQFSDFRITPVVTLAEGDLACVHWSATFRHAATSPKPGKTGTPPRWPRSWPRSSGVFRGPFVCRGRSLPGPSAHFSALFHVVAPASCRQASL